MKQALARLDRQTLHMTSLQATDPQEKFNTGDARELYAWIVPAILKYRGSSIPYTA